jgi:hypothetical protein
MTHAEEEGVLIVGKFDGFRIGDASRLLSSPRE